MADGPVGLDPDRTRELADAARVAATDAAAVADDVAAIVVAASITDNGVIGCCREVDQELGLLANALTAAADGMEGADAGWFVVAAGSLAALTSSLADGVGAGIDLDADPSDPDGAAVPMSSALAATILARYADDTGGAASVDELGTIAADESQPWDVRAAALRFVREPELWLEIPVEPGTAPSGDDYRHYAEQTLALGVLAANIASWTNAAGDEDGGDVADDISRRDLQAVADDTTGRFSPEERDAASTLMSDSSLWDEGPALTLNLVRRRVFGDRPGTAESYDEWAATRDQPPINPLQWEDEEPLADWVQASLLTAEGPADQVAAIGSLTALRLAVPPPQGLERERQVLQVISIFDKTPRTDAVIAVTEVIDGRLGDAAATIGGSLWPSKLDEIARRLGGALADQVVHRINDLTGISAQHPRDGPGVAAPPTSAEIVAIVTDEFGPFAGQVVADAVADGSPVPAGPGS